MLLNIRQRQRPSARWKMQITRWGLYSTVSGKVSTRSQSAIAQAMSRSRRTLNPSSQTTAAPELEDFLETGHELGPGVGLGLQDSGPMRLKPRSLHSSFASARSRPKTSALNCSSFQRIA